MKVLKLFIAKAKRRLYANGNWWTCPRCGTTNSAGAIFCSKCNNRRPY